MRRFACFILLLTFFAGINSFAQTLDGSTEINRVDDKGKKQGSWRKTDKEGRLIYQGSFLDDQPAGQFIYYDSTGSVKAQTEFTENGTKAYAISLYRSGAKMSEGLYINEKREGSWKFYNEEGVMISEELYKNGLADGIWKTYYANKAILEEISYHNGVKDGPWKQYFFDGPVKLNATYKNGKLEGLATFYHVNGRVMVSGPYVNNFKDGVWMHIDDKGVAEKREVWSAGFLSVEEYYDKAIEKMVKEEK